MGESRGYLTYIDISKIQINADQPRKNFESEPIERLTESIRDEGVLQPLLVRPLKGEEGYELIAGERRLRAAKQAGLAEVPVQIRAADDRNQLVHSLTENLHREDLNPIEQANACAKLVRETQLDLDACADLLNMHRTTFVNKVRLLDLSPRIQREMIKGSLSEGHAKVLLTLRDLEKREEACSQALERKLSVRQTETLCRKMTAQGTRERGSPQKSANIEYMADHLRGRLKTKVKISGDSRRGKIEISYFSLNELDRLISSMAGKPAE